ncbi:hypothetical protein [Sedimenticola selenatireducens]|uniref:hypothetical protein n=1 Tax=Sedimenticola selenatireducens TaxID=191960 RepID=UPI00048A7236|nr:hypothetical protein [Sedimenticola selenatireducens]
MDICGITVTPAQLTQVGLAIGFVGSLLLAFSVKIGTISEGGQIIFNGLDPMRPAEENKKKVLNSHRRNRYFTPIGWFLLAASFALQFAGTL